MKNLIYLPDKIENNPRGWAPLNVPKLKREQIAINIYITYVIQSSDSASAPIQIGEEKSRKDVLDTLISITEICME